MNGKGDSPRPLSISPGEFAARWAQTFADKARKQEQELKGRRNDDGRTHGDSATRAEPTDREETGADRDQRPPGDNPGGAMEVPLRQSRNDG